MGGGRDQRREARTEVRLLQGTLPGCDVFHSHETRESVLHRQPDRSMLPHLPHFLPRLLPSRGIRGEGQSGNDHPAGPGGLPVDGG